MVQDELVDAACYHVDEQLKVLREVANIFKHILQLNQSIGKLLRYSTDDNRVTVEDNQVLIDIDGDKAILIQYANEKLECSFSSSHHVESFDNSADMLRWLKPFLI